MHLNQIIELSMVSDNENFQKVLNRAYNEATNIDENGNEIIDQSIADKGIVVTYRDSQYKKKIKLIVNTSLILDFGTPDLDRLIRKLEKRISEYFHSEYQLEDFNLSGMILMSDINVGSQKQVSAYIKVLQRIGKVKGFSPSSFEGIDESISFCLDGNSNSIYFLIYDLTGAIVDRHRNAGASQKKLKSIIEKSKGVLRVEVRLTKRLGAFAETLDGYLTGIGADLHLINYLKKILTLQRLLHTKAQGQGCVAARSCPLNLHIVR